MSDATLTNRLESLSRDFERREWIESRTLLELGGYLRENLQHMTEARGWGDEGLSQMYQYDRSSREDRPKLSEETRLRDYSHRWIAVFPATGANEGHYVHVDLVVDHESRHESRRYLVPLFMVKTFGGDAEAREIAAHLQWLLGV